MSYLEAWLEASRLITYVHRCRNLNDEVFDYIMTYNPCVMATQEVADCIQGVYQVDRETERF